MISLHNFGCCVSVQIPPSTAYAPPMKRPIEEEEGTDDKSPNKKKKKLQKKCKFSFSSRCVRACVRLSGHGRTICAQVGAEETHLGDQM